MNELSNYLKIRKGTNSKTALMNSTEKIWSIILDNSYNFKTDRTIRINISIDPEKP